VKNNKEHIGKRGYVKVRTSNLGTFPFEMKVKVLDYKVTYGMKTYKVKPINGNGIAWVRNITFVKNHEK